MDEKKNEPKMPGVWEAPKVWEEVFLILEKHGVNNATLLLPGMGDSAGSMFYKGEFYNTAKLVSMAVMQIRKQMNEELVGL